LLALFTTTLGIACGAPPPTGTGGTGATGGTGPGPGPQTGPDGCGQSQARSLSIREVAVYQSLKIPIARPQGLIEPGARAADVIERRDTLFRVFVDLQGGWAARTLSARVTLTSGGVTTQYYEKKNVVVGSSEADLNSTFQVPVPADRVLPDARYSVEVVECGQVGGSSSTPRLPAFGDAALGARRTGPLKVRIVPIVANSRQPDTSANGLAPYSALLRAMYPVHSVEMTVAASVTTPYPLNWNTMLDQIRSRRASDGAAADVYYYGLVKPTDTISQYCGGGCVAGIGYVPLSATQASVRAAVGLGFADNTSASTMAHEIGHNHGRNHAPCAPGSIAGVDPAYPHPGALLGTWGFDPRNRTLFDPGRTTDIMGYCNNKWISDYTYKGLTERVAAVNSAFALVEDPELVLDWQVMLVEPPASRWGVPFGTPASPFGAAEPAEVLDESGNVIDRITVYRTEVSDIGSFTVLVPPARSGWHAVRVNGAAPLAFSAPVTVPAP
jgi:hypothetical protein